MNSILATRSNETPTRSRLRRFGLVAIPASLVTAGLFMAMQGLVEVDNFEPTKPTAYVIEAYMSPPVVNDQIKVRPPVQKAEVLQPPPRPEPLVKSVSDVDVPVRDYGGTIPADYGQADLDSIKPTRLPSFSIRDLQPLTPPIPNYPRQAEQQGIEGRCDVHLSVSPRGEPFDVYAECSDRVFESAAKKAVQKVRFAPKIHDGLPITVIGVVYPLEFRMEP